MKKLVALMFGILGASAFAQHCPFDGAGIIVLNIHAEDSAGIIPGLKIYLQDSLGKPYTVTEYTNSKWVDGVGCFWQNPDQTTFKGYIDNNNPAEPAKIRFPFARNNYVFATYDGFPLDRYKIVIEDGDCAKNGAFETKIIRLTGNDVYPLCSTYNQEVYHCPFKKVVYAPADIVLTRRN